MTYLANGCCRYQKNSIILSKIIAFCLCFLTASSYALDGDTKRQEMLYTSVFISTETVNGSGTIIGKTKTGMDGVFRYSVLTNEHVVMGRFVPDPKSPSKRIDKGCIVWTFDHTQMSFEPYPASVIAENKVIDIALLAFNSSEVLVVAKFATQTTLDDLSVFDEVFAIGCNLKDNFPGPTIGIISLIYTEQMGETNVTFYANTAQIVPGASGGGLFREKDGHYYLIGIPFRLYMLDNDQLLPHLAEAISISAVKNLIHKNTVILP